MQELQNVFKYEGREVRTVIINGAPWFVAKDVCEVLGLAKHDTALARLSGKQKGSHSVGTLGGNQLMSVVNEAGLYKLIFTSRKAEAERFSDWVVEEVLPTIRRTGSYTTAGATDALVVQATEILAAVSRLAATTQEALQASEVKFDRLSYELDNALTINNHAQTKVKHAIDKRIGTLEPDIIGDDGKKKRNPRRKPLFTQIYADIYQHFGVESYRDIKPKDFEVAVEFIRAWSPAVPLNA
ncbi:BRO family protein [Tumebacillus permanentifrigoris]|uniref:Prophage antirepressor-like protein n=1 Tax=Tumebacillus permanentifrigoris TaxID=378543 RepID=A0A316D7D6_9BACL|nr:BRO family protein [Tumebacillus permanentifrigoris]PWK10185.1 prophage antirepressor-like protein [Tumebacillus permanentifrigoris]